MEWSVGGYSFHLALEAGRQDIFQYIADCKDLGATQLDPWNAQLAPIWDVNQAVKAGGDPRHAVLTAQDDTYLAQVRAASDQAGLPFGCIAVDGAHIYEPDPSARDANRRLAQRWLDAARKLGAAQVRIDCGGTPDLPDDMFETIVTGYEDVVGRARGLGIEILLENHWGASIVPENVARIIEAVDGLGLLFDTNNWAPGLREQGWDLCARYARSTHIKTFSFDADGNDPSVDLARAIRTLVDTGYRGCWGIESCPADGDEFGAVVKTRELIVRTLQQLGVEA